MTRSSITAERAERGQTRLQCKSMQCMSTSIRNKGKSGKSGKGTSKKEARARRKMRNRSSSQASYAPSMASTISMQEMVPVHFPNPIASQHSETWYINMIVPAQKTLMVASLDGAGYALLDSGSGLTSCPVNHANVIPLLPRPSNLPILSNATRGSVNALVRDKSITGLRVVNHVL